MLEQLNEWTDQLANADLQRAEQVGLWPFVVLLLTSLAAALVISYLYLHFYSSRATGSQIQRAFPLLALSVTAIFVCIQFSLPLSLGLLGALSIVRFRTPIKEPEEIGFIMLVIASSLACATFNFLFLAAILVVALGALLLGRLVPSIFLGRTSQDGSLIVAVPPEGYAARGAEVVALLEQRLKKAKFESISRNEDGIVLSLTFNAAPPQGMVALEAELRKIVEPSYFNILYSRPGAL